MPCHKSESYAVLFFVVSVSQVTVLTMWYASRNGVHANLSNLGLSKAVFGSIAVDKSHHTLHGLRLRDAFSRQMLWYQHQLLRQQIDH